MINDTAVNIVDITASLRVKYTATLSRREIRSRGQESLGSVSQFTDIFLNLVRQCGLIVPLIFYLCH